MEVFKEIAAIVGCVLSVISLITLCSNGGRAFIKNIFKKNTKDLRDENKKQTSSINTLVKKIDDIEKKLALLLEKTDALEEVSKQQCRDTIKEIYYKYQKEKKIPLYERKTVDKTYALYKDLFDGNTYAELLHNEIIKWEIDSKSFSDFSED